MFPVSCDLFGYTAPIKNLSNILLYMVIRFLSDFVEDSGSIVYLHATGNSYLKLGASSIVETLAV
jgi:hypothetical protein